MAGKSQTIRIRIDPNLKILAKEKSESDFEGNLSLLVRSALKRIIAKKN